MSAISVLDLAKARGVKEHPVDGSINGSEFTRVGLPITAGCQVCHESLGPWNAYPSSTGYIRCRGCLGDLGFESAADFEAWAARNFAIGRS